MLCLNIVYLKADDTKSQRTIMPKSIGTMEYMNKDFLGLEAYCYLRKDDRNFKIDRILEIKEVK